jgi:hypothetical protein
VIERELALADVQLVPADVLLVPVVLDGARAAATRVGIAL